MKTMNYRKSLNIKDGLQLFYVANRHLVDQWVLNQWIRYEYYIEYYFLSVRMKQIDWLRGLSERVGILHPARSETQLPAV
jgi:hypothetical protein